MSNLTELQAIVQDIIDCGSSREEAKQIIADALPRDGKPRSTRTVEGWLSKGQTMPIPDDVLELLKTKL